ncbi:MAG: hypothetical protein ACYC4Q_10430, partial [Victivallaceae bacterium]
GSPKLSAASPMPTNAIYDSNTVADRDLILGGAIAEYPVEVASGSVYGFATGVACGTLYVTDSEGLNAIFSLKGLGHATAEVADSWNAFSHTAGTANSTNVYWATSPIGKYVIQNNRGVTRKYKITLIGSNLQF